MRRPAVLVVAAMALAAAVGACGEDPPAATGPGTTTSAPSTAAGVGFATDEVESAGTTFGLLRAVKVEGGGDDRVVFEFEGDLPGYRIGYVERPVVQDGSGDEIPVEGGAVLGVHFEPASGVDLSGSDLRVVYDGPQRIAAGTDSVVEVVRVGDFEANLVWAVGTAERLPFRVRTHDQPNRIEIELRAAGG